MKILSLTAENVKKIRAVHIEPDGAMVQVTGANGSGKSSVLDAIYMGLAGTKAIPTKPIRAGAEKARIRLDLGDVIVTRRFTSSGNTSLTVEAADGARYPSPQRMLDELLGSLTFDPLEFSRMSPKLQMETLRDLVQLDIDIDALDRENAADYDARTDINRRAKALRAQADGIVVAPDTPAEPVDVSELTARMQAASEANANIERRRARRENAAAQIQAELDLANRALDRAAELREEAEHLERDAEKAKVRAAELQDALDAAGDLPAPTNVAEIRAQIDAAAETNRKVENRRLRDDLVRQATAAEGNAAALTQRIEDRAKRRAEAIANAAMPVEGLSFGDGEVLYNGIPFSQASSAEQLRVSVAIAMAANPKLRVLRIKDGSLLDENGLQLVAEMAEAADYQVWVERVDTSGAVGIVMEDGAVRGAEAEAEPEAAE